MRSEEEILVPTERFGSKRVVQTKDLESKWSLRSEVSLRSSERMGSERDSDWKEERPGLHEGPRAASSSWQPSTALPAPILLHQCAGC